MNNLKEKLYDNSQHVVIALDGPSASGKGLIGKLLAAEFNLQYVQSSIVYRGLAYRCLEKNIGTDEIDKIILLSENEKIIEENKEIDLNQEIIGDYASKISLIPKVRDNLNRLLLRLIKETPRIIMEGRDITTVVAKDADLKIFITADIKTRAARRYKQLQEQGKKCILEDISRLLEERDQRDSTREHAPLRIAHDALVIDSGGLRPQQVILKIREYIG